VLTAVSGQLTTAATVPIVLGTVLDEFPKPINNQVGIYMVNGIGLVGAIVGPVLKSFRPSISIKSIFVVGWALMSLSLVMVVIFQLAGVPAMLLVSLALLEFAW
jgi:hypothetical protein